jgi:TPR repeat protein
LNGLGLMHLMGIHGGVLKVDLSMAEKYFTLAKELGSMDAYYNLGTYIICICTIKGKDSV